MTEAQQKVSVGQVLKTRAGGEVTVLSKDEIGVMATKNLAARCWVEWLPWETLVLPEPQKAKPGVRYKWSADFSLIGIGLANGEIFSTRTKLPHSFVPDEWREVPE